MLRPVEPILIAHMLPELHGELMQLLRPLSRMGWLWPTPVPDWDVHDVVAHLLDTDLRRVSSQRDGYRPAPIGPPPASYAELVALLNRMNDQWVVASRRISPTILLDMLDLIAPQAHAFLASLDPMAPAAIGVAWAGEQQSANWFDVAREYTEKWHHQQHIREAVGAPLLVERRWLYPALDTFMRGLPHAYRDLAAPDGTDLTVAITGDAGGEWTLGRRDGAWRLFWGAAPAPAARAELDDDTAWRLFTKGLEPEHAAPYLTVAGDEQLGRQLLHLLAIMA